MARKAAAPTGVAPDATAPPDIEQPDIVEPEDDDDETVGEYVAPPGAIPYEIDGRAVPHHEYAEWRQQQVHAQVLADLQAAAEGRGETPPEPEEVQ